VAGTPELAAKFAKLACYHAFERGLSPEELKEILRMRERIEKERGDRGRPELEFKTGPGGLIDVEFLAQAKQMQHGGKHSELRTPNTLDAIESLGHLGLLEDSQKRSLLDGYCFLRRVESALRRVENQSVSALPSDPAEQAALAKRLGFAERDSFWKMYESHRKIIRQIFEEKLQ
jgi:glutamate-ammonia-ligase adenylyltransferase